MTRQEQIWVEWLAHKDSKKRLAETKWMLELPPLGTCIDITAECGKPGRYESTVKAWINATFSRDGRALVNVDTFEVHDQTGSEMLSIEWAADFSLSKDEVAMRFNLA